MMGCFFSFNNKSFEMRVLSFCLLLLFSSNLQSQDGLNTNLEKLKFFGDVMVSALDADNRTIAGDQFYSSFKIYIDSKNLFEEDLSSFQTISVINTEDAKFKLISWQIEKTSFVFTYHAFVVFPDGSYAEFMDKGELSESIQYMDVDISEWYGALYYNIKKVSDTEYLIFGYNGYGQYDHVKVADYLVVDNNTVRLGAEVFEDREEEGLYMQRLLIKYSADASVNLNYNPGLDMIVLDHLTPRMGKLQGQGPTLIPDGTYEGFELVDGKWQYISKLYNHSYGENNAPRPKPVLDKKKNIFGQ